MLCSKLLICLFLIPFVCNEFNMTHNDNCELSKQIKGDERDRHNFVIDQNFFAINCFEKKMFRTIFNQAKRPFDLSALTAGYCTKAPVQRRLRGKQF